MLKTAWSPDFIAHRGDAASHPENTLPAIEAAFRCGLKWVEIDVHFSADDAAIVIHDGDLLRTAGVPGRVAQMTSDELARTSVHEPARLGPSAKPIAPPTLEAAAGMLDEFPGAGLFVEIKVEAVMRLGRSRALEIVTRALGTYANRCVIISFDSDLVEQARTHHGFRNGWVLTDYTLGARRRAQELEPDFLFINLKKVPAHQHLFPGPWSWAVYEVSTMAEAISWCERGARLMESFQACELATRLG
jgi:glycerophosphoryl diester phosphodiesterase